MRISDGSSDVGSSDLRCAVVKRERRRLGGGQDLDGAVLQLDLAGGQLAVRGALEAALHGAGDAQHVLAPQIVGLGHDALGDARAVAQVDEGQVLTVLAPVLHTPAQRSEEHTSELQSLMRNSYAVLC